MEVSSASSRRRTTEPIPRLITSEASFEIVMLAKPFNTAFDMIFLKHSVNRSKSARMWLHLVSWLHPRQEVTPSLISHRLPQKVQGSTVTCFSSPNRSQAFAPKPKYKTYHVETTQSITSLHGPIFMSLSPAPTATPVGKAAAAGALLAADGVCLGTCQGHAAGDRRGIVSIRTRKDGASHPRSKNMFVSPAYNSLLSKAPSGMAPSRATRTPASTGSGSQNTSWSS